MIIVSYPSVINGKKNIHIIDPDSPLGEQVIKLFHYSDSGSLQIIPVNLEIKVGRSTKSITVFVSTLSEKSVGYRKTINKRDIEPVPKVQIDDDYTNRETVFEKIGRRFSEFFYSLR